MRIPVTAMLVIELEGALATLRASTRLRQWWQELRFLAAAQPNDVQLAALRYIFSDDRPGTPDIVRARVVTIDGATMVDWLTHAHLLRQEETSFGAVDVLSENSDMGVYRLRIYPGHTIPMHCHRALGEEEMVLTQGLYLQGQPVKLGKSLRWEQATYHRYENPSPREQMLLCINRPAFDPADEVITAEYHYLKAVL